MIREEKFLISHAPYAVDLDSLEVQEYQRPDGATRYRQEVTAVWFRRKSGVLTSHLGTLWNYTSDKPADAAAFLQAHTDGRYGGHCISRWDGESFWGNVKLLEQMKQMDILLPMLEDFPQVPRGFDGWWTFKAGGQS